MTRCIAVLCLTILVRCNVPDNSGYEVRSNYGQNLGQHDAYKGLGEQHGQKQHQHDEWYREEQDAARRKECERALVQSSVLEQQRQDTEQRERQEQQQHNERQRLAEQAERDRHEHNERQRVAEQEARDNERAAASRDDEERRYAHRVQQHTENAHRWDTEHTRTVQQETEKDDALRRDYDTRQVQYQDEDRARQVDDNIRAQADDRRRQDDANEHVSRYADAHKQSVMSDRGDRQEHKQQHQQRQDEDAYYNKLKAEREHRSIVREAQRRQQSGKTHKHVGVLTKLMRVLGLSSKGDKAHKQVQKGEAERVEKDALQSLPRHLQKEQHISLESEKRVRDEKRRVEQETELQVPETRANTGDEGVETTSQSQRVQVLSATNSTNEQKQEAESAGQNNAQEQSAQPEESQEHSETTEQAQVSALPKLVTPKKKRVKETLNQKLAGWYESQTKAQQKPPAVQRQPQIGQPAAQASVARRFVLPTVKTEQSLVEIMREQEEQEKTSRETAKLVSGETLVSEKVPTQNNAAHEISAAKTNSDTAVSKSDTEQTQKAPLKATIPKPLFPQSVPSRSLAEIMDEEEQGAKAESETSEMLKKREFDINKEILTQIAQPLQVPLVPEENTVRQWMPERSDAHAAYLVNSDGRKIPHVKRDVHYHDIPETLHLAYSPYTRDYFFRIHAEDPANKDTTICAVATMKYKHIREWRSALGFVELGFSETTSAACLGHMRFRSTVDPRYLHLCPIFIEKSDEGSETDTSSVKVPIAVSEEIFGSNFDRYRTCTAGINRDQNVVFEYRSAADSSLVKVLTIHNLKHIDKIRTTENARKILEPRMRKIEEHEQQ